jgi:phosphoglycerate dehydrogenase-like enzyme
MATGFPAVCSFVNDRVDAETIATLQAGLSEQVLQDDVLARLLTFPNVLITSHQAFLTREALANIADTTLANVSAFERGECLLNEVRAEQVLKTLLDKTAER